METSIIFAVAIIFFVLIIIIKGVKIVPQSDLYVIERLGKFNKELHGGFHLIIPIIDQVRAILTSREQLVDIEKQSVITKDNVNISIDGIVFCKVDDAMEATYNVVDFKNAIDGNYFQTENNYTAIVYYRGNNDRYDRVIGIANTNSEVIRN